MYSGRYRPAWRMIQTGVVSTGSRRRGFQETAVVQFRSEQSKVFQQRNGHAGGREPPTTERGDTATLFIRWSRGNTKGWRASRVSRMVLKPAPSYQLTLNVLEQSTTCCPLPVFVSFCLKCIGTEGNEGNKDFATENRTLSVV